MAHPIQKMAVPPLLIEPAALFAALGNPIRLEALRRIVTIGPQSVNDLAAATGLAQDAMSRHMTVLWNTRAVIIVAPPDGDGRKRFFGTPPGCVRETPGGKEIDYGSCVLRFPGATSAAKAAGGKD